MSPSEHLRRLDELGRARSLALLGGNARDRLLGDTAFRNRVALVVDAEHDVTWAEVGEAFGRAISWWEASRPELPLLRLSAALGLGLDHRLLLSILLRGRGDPATAWAQAGLDGPHLLDQLGDCGVIGQDSHADRAEPAERASAGVRPQLSSLLSRALRTGELGPLPESWVVAGLFRADEAGGRKRGGLDTATLRRLSRARADVLVLRASAGSDRLDAASAIVARAGTATEGLLVLPAEEASSDVAALAAATGRALVLTVDEATADGRVPHLTGWPRPRLVLASPSARVTAGAGQVTIPVELLPPTTTDRARMWAEETGHTNPPGSENLLLPLGHLRRVAATSRALADASGASVGADHVRAAGRELAAGQLDGLADRVDAQGDLNDLVVPAAIGEQLATLQQWIVNRHRLATLAGPGLTTSGVRALFSGPSGTGKTLAAGLLGAAAAKDVWRVDLAQIHDKYVGEAMKRTQRVLARAEELDVVLLLDEGDLLTRRTEVTTANDRWANADVSYLLQRLESYNGIVIVTTNLAEQIDPAFERRFDLTITFIPPGPTERAELLRRHLPSSSPITDSELVVLAREAELTGGEIRNACRTAAVLAAGDDTIGLEGLRAGVDAECVKAGRRPPRRAEPVAARSGGVAAFLDELW